MVTEPGSERASYLDRRARLECSPSFATEKTARPAVLRTIALRRNTIARRRPAAPVLPRQCADRRSPTRAGARVRRSGRPFRTRICRVARADQMAIVKPPLLGLDRVADAAPRLHGMGDVAPPGHQPPRRTFRARRPVPSARGERCSRSPRPPHRGANQGALFRLTGNRRWPHCGPMEHPDRADPPTARYQKIAQMQRIPGFRRMGDPGLAPGTSSLSGIPFVPSSPPNSQLIPANRCDGAGGRGLEGTGEDKLVAP